MTNEQIKELRELAVELDGAYPDDAKRVRGAIAEIERLTVRLQTAEKAAHEWAARAARVAESSWDKAHVEAGFRRWDGEDPRDGWDALRECIEAEEAGA